MQWLMLQQPQPEDFVIATGEQHTVREFVSLAAERLGLPLEWTGSGADEKGIDRLGQVRVSVDARYCRPAEVETLLGRCHPGPGKAGSRPFSEPVSMN